MLEFDPGTSVRSDGLRGHSQKRLLRPEMAGRKSRPLVFGLSPAAALVTCLVGSEFLEAFLAVRLQDSAIDHHSLCIGRNLNGEASAVLAANAPVGEPLRLTGRRHP